MPVGPVETNKVWYARARMGVHNIAFYVWGAAVGPRGEWFILSTRIAEKPVQLSVALLRELLQKLDLSTTTTLHWWSDAGYQIEHVPSNRIKQHL